MKNAIGLIYLIGLIVLGSCSSSFEEKQEAAQEAEKALTDQK